MRILLLSIAIIFQGGFTACSNEKEKHEIVEISNDEFKKVYAETPNVQLVDVRTPEEYEEGHIYDAQNINFLEDDFSTNIVKLKKKEPIYLYCRSGNRSSQAAAVLKDSGFVKIYNLKEGYSQWD